MMAKAEYDITKQNVAKAMGVTRYCDLVNADDAATDALIKKAQKRIRFKSALAPKSYPSGNPYTMLGRKINSEGKYIK